MAWGNSLSVEAVQEDSRSASMPTDWLPFDARLHTPIVKPVPTMPTIDEDIPVVDQREREREEVKTNLQSIMRNRLLSETARVAAARELSRILDNEEIDELREEVKRLTAIVNENTPDESELPPHLRRRR